MLSIDKLDADADPAAYYLEALAGGAEDYYLTADEAPGRWVGQGSSLLELTGQVEPDDLRAVLRGDDPRTGQHLGTERTVAGFDLTLSAPKSVSVLWGLGNRQVAGAVVAAHDEAVDAALAYLEDAACLVRRGRGGRNRLAGQGLVGAAFRHRTSRAGDPHLHTHVVVANMALGPDDAWSALFGAALYEHGRTAGFLYQAALRHGLTTRLGVGFEPASNGVGEVAGVPLGLRRLFSQRRIEIEAAMEQHGVRTAHGAQVATLATRGPKEHGVTESELRARWRERARELKLDVRITRHRHEAGGISDDELAATATHQHATFGRRAVLQIVAERATAGLPYAAVAARVETFLAGPCAVTVRPGQWSTPEMLAFEADALRRAGAGPATHAVPLPLLDAALDARPSLSGEQRIAIEEITTSGAPVAVVVGHAGAGKTFALDAARAAWQANGRTVLGAALAARAARQLQSGSGIRSGTLTSLLGELEDDRLRIGPRHVVVLDEAGMVGTRQLHRLITATTSTGAELVLVGDPKQLAEIEAGGLFAALARQLGCSRLTENRRQRDPAERETALAFRDRDVERSLLLLRRNQRLTTLPNAEDLRDRMAEDWLLEHRDGRSALMLASHRSDVADLNRRARRLLRSTGALGEPVLTVEGTPFAVGDHVVALRNHRRIGVLNGTRGTVAGRSGDGLTITTDDDATVDVPSRYLLAGHLDHAYAMTVHKSQGSTVDVALVLGDDTLHAEGGYTAITRGRLRNQLYAVQAVPDDLQLLRRSLARSTAKTTATEQRGLAL